MTEPACDVRNLVEVCSRSFTYLRMRALLERLPPPALQALRQWLACPDDAGPILLTGEQKGAILEACLLQCPPFREATPPSMKDTRLRPPHGRRFRPCQDRPRLITALADDLREYEMECSAHDRAWPLGQQHAPAILDGVRHAVEVLLTLRARGIAPANPRLRRLRRERLLSSLDTLRQVLEGLTLEDYRQVDRPHPVLSMQDYSYILLRMVQHVRDYGPRKFSNEGRYHVVASLLIAFGLEHGQPAKVARRLQKRLSQLKW
jgi:hypothetical protein